METPILVPRCSLLPRVPTAHAPHHEHSTRCLRTVDHVLGCIWTALLAAQYCCQQGHARPSCLGPQSGVPWHLLRLLRHSGRPAAVLDSPQALPHRGAVDQLMTVASPCCRVTADGQGEWAMHSALSLVATWRNCPRRGPPPYNVGSLPGEAPVRRSMAAARASPHPGCEFLGVSCDSIGLRGCSDRAFVHVAGNLQPSRALPPKPANLGISYS